MHHRSCDSLFLYNARHHSHTPHADGAHGPPGHVVRPPRAAAGGISHADRHAHHLRLRPRYAPPLFTAFFSPPSSHVFWPLLPALRDVVPWPSFVTCGSPCVFPGPPVVVSLSWQCYGLPQIRMMSLPHRRTNHKRVWGCSYLLLPLRFLSSSVASTRHSASMLLHCAASVASMVGCLVYPPLPIFAQHFIFVAS